MRAERVKLKSCKDDRIIAQGKRRAAPELCGGGGTSAALGWGPKMYSSPFSRLVARARWRLPLAGLQTPSADPPKPSPDWESPLAALQTPPVALPTPLAGLETPFADWETPFAD